MSLPILIINLKNRSDSLVRTFNELYKLGNTSNTITRINATDSSKAKELKYNYITHNAEKNIGNIKSTIIFPTWASVGCAISHIECWKYIVSTGMRYALIVEDDIKVNDHNKLNYSINESIHILDSNRYDKIFISLNSKTDLHSSLSCSSNINKYYYQFTGTSSYFINIECCKFLLQTITPLKHQVDIEISRLFLKNRFNSGTNIAGIYIDSGINNYDHISSVQYYFISYKQLKTIIESTKYYLPNEIISIIYKNMPKKQDIQNNNLYGYYSIYNNNYYNSE